MCFESAILTVSAHSKIKQVFSSVAQQAFFKADLSGDGPCKGVVVSNFSIQKYLLTMEFMMGRYAESAGLGSCLLSERERLL